MLDLIKKGKALIIFGHENSGKTTVAKQEAEKLGTWVISNIKYVFSPFGLGIILNSGIKSIIVDDCPVEILNDPRIKSLISEDKLLVEKRGKKPEIVLNIQWIFVVCLDKRFSIISL